MLGLGVFKGMRITLRHFFDTYFEDARLKGFPHTLRPDAKAVVQSPLEEGIFTVQYPEEKLKVPERFRFFPMLLYDAETGEERCTSCGICAKVCPPQCIWIVRATGDDGKPKPQPAEFYIDNSICMQCGFCDEFCPFDAIKMMHDFELSSYERHNTWVYDKYDLMISTDLYAETHPTRWAAEEAARRAKERNVKREA